MGAMERMVSGSLVEMITIIHRGVRVDALATVEELGWRLE